MSFAEVFVAGSAVSAIFCGIIIDRWLKTLEKPKPKQPKKKKQICHRWTYITNELRVCDFCGRKEQAEYKKTALRTYRGNYATKVPTWHRAPQVVVVNDCGFVWEDLKPYLPKEVEWKFITRDRSLWGKTFGLFWKILRSHGNIYIVNFALQDAWLVQKLKHLDLLICHGGDLRKTLHRRKWGWMVRSNVKAARAVAYTSEDTGKIAKSLRDDAFLLHRPIQTGRYIPHNHNRLNLMCVYFEKAYDKVPTELVNLLTQNECTLTTVPRGTVKHEDMPTFLSQFDVFIDQTTNPDLSKVCLEAMSCGLPTITWHDKTRLKERVAELMNPEQREIESQRNRQFVVDNYDAQHVALEIQTWVNTVNPAVSH